MGRRTARYHGVRPREHLYVIHNILKLILHTLEAQTLRVSGRKPRASRRPRSWWKQVESCTRLKGFGLKVPSLLTVVIHAFTSITVLLSFICQQTCLTAKTDRTQAVSIKCTFTRFVFERYYIKHFYGPCNSHEIKELHEKNTSKNLH